MLSSNLWICVKVLNVILKYVLVFFARLKNGLHYCKKVEGLYESQLQRRWFISNAGLSGMESLTTTAGTPATVV